ncbi:hypothetical protein KSS87_005351 [Heliosperma pusillum]|nr:hypothetical protein KSS87_005351 [Heliosperma pusillum]
MNMNVIRERMKGERIEGRFCEEFTAGYYGLCTIGGMLSAGTTHLAITPLDVLKVNMQVNPIKYNGISSGFTILWSEHGASGLWRGWSGKFFGYGIQGGFKFGLYEYFKKLYSDVLVTQNKSTIYFLSGASAQVFADVALCPFESIKVRVQTQTHFARGLADGFPKVYRAEGLSGFYKGLLPLWSRNLPCNNAFSYISNSNCYLVHHFKSCLLASFSMVMFTTFEHSVDLIYRKIIQREKENCTRLQQLGVTCLAGYAAGAVGTVISNPADVIVSSLYNKKADSVVQAVKKIGIWNLFTRSLPVRIALVGPVVTMQWFFYDTIKVLSGLPASGGLPRHVEESISAG